MHTTTAATSPHKSYDRPVACAPMPIDVIERISFALDTASLLGCWGATEKRVAALLRTTQFWKAIAAEHQYPIHLLIPQYTDELQNLKWGFVRFHRCSRLQKESLREGAVSVGPGAFYMDSRRCVSGAAPSIVPCISRLPASLRSICDNAFRSCTFDKQFCTLPNATETIGKYAFARCYSLTTTSLPAKLKVIDEYAFYSCIGLRLTHLPAKLTTISRGAFKGCCNLVIESIPASVTHIADGAFHRAEQKLSEFVIDQILRRNQNAFGDTLQATHPGSN